VDILENVSPYEAFIEVYHFMGEPYRKAQTARYMTAFDAEACLTVPTKLIQWFAEARHVRVSSWNQRLTSEFPVVPRQVRLVIVENRQSPICHANDF
jgi:hypothetical protein